jgi:hypothetical protein
MTVSGALVFIVESSSGNMMVVATSVVSACV